SAGSPIVHAPTPNGGRIWRKRHVAAIPDSAELSALCGAYSYALAGMFTRGLGPAVGPRRLTAWRCHTSPKALSLMAYGPCRRRRESGLRDWPGHAIAAGARCP